MEMETSERNYLRSENFLPIRVSIPYETKNMNVKVDKKINEVTSMNVWYNKN